MGIVRGPGLIPLDYTVNLREAAEYLRGSTMGRRYFVGGFLLLNSSAYATDLCNTDVLADPLDAVFDGNLGVDWLETAIASPKITLVAPDRGLIVTLAARVTFGPYEVRWVQGPFALTASTNTQESLEIPPEAFLHTLQTTYVSDLWVRVNVVEMSGAPGQESVLYARLIWPDGAEMPPVVWTNDEAALLAPHGTIDPVVQADAAKFGENVRLYPPIWHEVVGTGMTDEERLERHVTVPVDDQSDEVMP
jgi:hypothetical protein